jgi:hypothetical protein
MQHTLGGESSENVSAYARLQVPVDIAWDEEVERVWAANQYVTKGKLASRLRRGTDVSASTPRNHFRGTKDQMARIAAVWLAGANESAGEMSRAIMLRAAAMPKTAPEDKSVNDAAALIVKTATATCKGKRRADVANLPADHRYADPVVNDAVHGRKKLGCLRKVEVIAELRARGVDADEKENFTALRERLRPYAKEESSSGEHIKIRAAIISDAAEDDETEYDTELSVMLAGTRGWDLTAKGFRADCVLGARRATPVVQHDGIALAPGAQETEHAMPAQGNLASTVDSAAVPEEACGASGVAAAPVPKCAESTRGGPKRARAASAKAKEANEAAELMHYIDADGEGAQAKHRRR